MAEKTKVVIIAGPTASSKSEIALQLALKFNGEIINADSVQVYRYFDIGSAKPSREMRAVVPHHLIDILDPKEEFNAFKFKELARFAVKDISLRKKLPIIVGGTGLYIRCLIYNLFPQDEEKIMLERKKLEELYKTVGLEKLYEKLKEVDPEAAKKIHPHDKVRTLRALEFYFATGLKISSMHSLYNFNKSEYDFKIFVPLYSKSESLERIKKRTEEIFKKGIVEEVESILKRGYLRHIKPLKSIGYKEALMVVDGLIDKEQAIQETIKNTKAYAKRQRIWFKRERNTEFIPITNDDFVGFIEAVKLFLHKT